MHAHIRPSQPNGYIRWYNLPAELDGKTMTVQMPAGAGFVLFDAMGQTVNQSAVTGDTQVTLPGGGANRVLRPGRRPL